MDDVTTAATNQAAQDNTTEETTTTKADTTPNGNTGENQGFVPPATQADLDRIIESRLARERKKYEGFDDYKQAAQKLKEIEDAGKTQEQKDAEEIQALRAQIAKLEARDLRNSVAARFKLDPKVLTGDSEQVLVEQAQAIVELIEASKPKAPTVNGENSGTSPQGSGDWLRDLLSKK